MLNVWQYILLHVSWVCFLSMKQAFISASNDVWLSVASSYRSGIKPHLAEGVQFDQLNVNNKRDRLAFPTYVAELEGWSFRWSGRDMLMQILKKANLQINPEIGENIFLSIQMRKCPILFMNIERDLQLDTQSLKVYIYLKCIFCQSITSLIAVWLIFIFMFCRWVGNRYCERIFSKWQSKYYVVLFL